MKMNGNEANNEQIKQSYLIYTLYSQINNPNIDCAYIRYYFHEMTRVITMKLDEFEQESWFPRVIRDFLYSRAVGNINIYFWNRGRAPLAGRKF